VRRKPVEQRRQELIAAATEVIGEVGIQGATTRAIVARAGMPLASFHYAFESREALFAACIDVLIDQDAVLLSQVHITEADVDSATEAALRSFANLVREQWRVQRAHYELSFHAQQHPDLVAVAARYRSQANVLVRRLLGELKPGWPLDAPAVADLVTLVLTVTDGMTSAYIRFQDDAELERAVRIGAAVIVRAIDEAGHQLNATRR